MRVSAFAPRCPVPVTDLAGMLVMQCRPCAELLCLGASPQLRESVPCREGRGAVVLSCPACGLFALAPRRPAPATGAHILPGYSRCGGDAVLGCPTCVLRLGHLLRKSRNPRFGRRPSAEDARLASTPPRGASLVAWPCKIGFRAKVFLGWRVIPCMVACKPAGGGREASPCPASATWRAPKSFARRAVLHGGLRLLRFVAGLSA